MLALEIFPIGINHFARAKFQESNWIRDRETCRMTSGQFKDTSRCIWVLNGPASNSPIDRSSIGIISFVNSAGSDAAQMEKPWYPDSHCPVGRLNEPGAIFIGNSGRRENSYPLERVTAFVQSLNMILSARDLLRWFNAFVADQLF